MSLWSKLFGRRNTALPTEARSTIEPIALRDRLITAVKENEEQHFAELCGQHADQIAREFPNWKTVPVEIRNDREQSRFYVRTIIAIAQAFNAAGNPQLLAQLQTPDAQNPAVKWNEQIEQAKKLLKEWKLSEAIEVAQAALIDNRKLAGDLAEHNNGLAQAILGHAHYRQGRMRDAIGHFQQAVAACRTENDIAGVPIYLERLCDAHRYLSETAAAADYAEELASEYERQSKPALARRAGRDARIARAGEPLLRMQVRVDDEPPYELDEVSAPMLKNAKILLTYARNRPTVGLSQRLVEQGGRLGHANKTDEAIALFREAAKVDPYDPDPHYKLGLALLSLQRHVEAVEAYETTERLAPGWFNVRADLWTARELVMGRVTHEQFMLLWFLEDGQASPADKLKLADKLQAEAMSLPPVYLHRGIALRSLGNAAEAISAFRRGLELSPEPDLKSRLLMHLHMVLPKGEERSAVLREGAAIADGHLLVAAMTELMLLTE
jgi:tetratricopeptide (TPR) repeat protein